MRLIWLSFGAIDPVVLAPAGARKATLPGAALRAGLLGAAGLVAACSVGAPAIDEPAEEPASAPIVASAALQAKPGEYRFHSAVGARLRFPVLRAGVLIEERHFDPSLPASKFRHSIHLSTEAGPAVILEVWDNPQRLDVHAWFNAHLAFLVSPGSRSEESPPGDAPRVSERPMTRARVAGILVEQPPSPQAPSQSIAVFALGDQIVRVSGLDPEGNAKARAMFERIVEQIDVEVAR
jgi:hypothetical protein